MKIRRIVALAATAMSLLVVAGCATGPAVFRSISGYIHSVGEVSEEPLCDEPIGEEAGALIGPHFAFSVSCAAFSPSLQLLSHMDISAVYPDGVPPSATAGHEFVVVQLASNPGARPYHPITDSTDVTAFFLMGDKRIELPELPENGDVLVAVGPAKEPAYLVVSDSGMEQRFDLREGVRESVVEGYYHGVEGFKATDGYSMRIEGENSQWTGWAEGSGDISLTRTLWDEELGWPKEGRGFVTVEVSWYVHEEDGKIAWDIKPEKMVSLTGADDEKYDILENRENDDTTWIYYEYVFDVPEDVTEFTVSFNPKGSLRILDDGSKLSTTKKPKAEKHTVDFAS
ncbi:hypothetical protein [Stackebrandtia soli]|uniref:hypothetical protein n=1 Tax=Stackebrandtia soli TaxID=1892856 RepID=UPI0039ED3CA7